MKTILYVLALMMLLPPAFAASAELSAGNGSGNADSNVQIPINLKSSVGVGSIDVEVSYDAKILQLESVDKGSLTGNSLMDYNSKMPGSVIIALADSEGVKGEGSIAILKFKTMGKEGERSAITIKSVKATEAATFIDVRIDTKDGSFSVISGGKGSSFIGTALIVIILVVIVLVVKRRGLKSK